MPSFIEIGEPLTLTMIDASPWRLNLLAERSNRMGAANELIWCISKKGRRFFSYGIDKNASRLFPFTQNEKVSRFKLAQNGRLWFLDGYTDKLIYTHYNGEWRDFTNGGTMRRLVQSLRDFIMTGKLLYGDLGPWPEMRGMPLSHSNDRWAYGSDMELVRQKALELKII